MPYAGPEVAVAGDAGGGHVGDQHPPDAPPVGEVEVPERAGRRVEVVRRSGAARRRRASGPATPRGSGGSRGRRRGPAPCAARSAREKGSAPSFAISSGPSWSRVHVQQVASSSARARGRRRPGSSRRCSSRCCPSGRAGSGRRAAPPSRVGGRPAQRQVSRRDDVVRRLPGDVLEHRLAGREVPVDVREDGDPHGARMYPLRTWRPSAWSARPGPGGQTTGAPR